MSNFEEEAYHVLEDMHTKVTYEIEKCYISLIKLSEGKSYNDFYHVLKCHAPFSPRTEVRRCCHEQLIKLLSAKQANEIINTNKSNEEKLREENERLLKENEALEELLKSNITILESFKEEKK
ncbi:hypothetical protein HB837_15375 [Listeria innocua]|nr:hypothetical protein [Listeria innocua]